MSSTSSTRNTRNTRNCYVTTPIYYVNSDPHIGHIYTTVIADTLARYRRLAGDETYFLTGTDEHGQKIARAAEERGLAPIELADEVVARYRAAFERMGISNDDFIRTTEPRHLPGVEDLIRRIEANGDFYVGRHEGWYCTSCELFYTDKELEGDDHLCPVHESPAEWQAEENVFFRLSRYTEPLLRWLDENPHAVRPQSRRNEVRSFVEQGLRDLSVSRADQPWGLSFPGHEGHTVYVWLDALTNYISALGFGSDGTDLYDQFWAGDSPRIQLVGKDILRFHAIYWPAFLMSAGLPLPTTIWAHGWWLRDAKKVSKSVGNIVQPDELITDFGPDSLRFFLLREMVFGQDASFSDEAFVDRFNSDLANDLGNTVSRVVTLARRAFDGKTPPAPSESPLEAVAKEAVEDYQDAFENLAFHKGLAALYRLLAETNAYLVREEPWKKLKDPELREEVGAVLWSGLEAVRVVAVGLLPVMPTVAPQVLAAIGAGEAPTTLDAMAWGGLAGGQELPETPSLFPRIDKAKYLAKGTEAKPEAAAPAAAVADEDQIGIDQFFETQLKVGDVLAAEEVPKSSKLLKLTIDLGEGSPRTVVAGIKAQYAPEDLVGTQVIVVANLKPAKLMGIQSQGMVLAASVEGKPFVVRPQAKVPAGTRVS